MDIQPIKTEQDYEQALERIDTLMDAAADTPEGDELDLLTTLVEAYEARHHPVLPPDPIDAIRYQAEQLGLSRKDLEPYIGSSGRVSEVLNGKWPLTLPMIWRLHRGLRIPLEVLIQERGQDNR
jgi:HTH-type transcriptional regulator/antitoxin HigA